MPDSKSKTLIVLPLLAITVLVLNLTLLPIIIPIIILSITLIFLLVTLALLVITLLLLRSPLVLLVLALGVSGSPLLAAGIIVILIPALVAAAFAIDVVHAVLVLLAGVGVIFLLVAIY